jgi:hypothetical protein
MGPCQDAASVTVTRTDAERIKEISERHPGWDIHRVFGGWEAIPAGMAVIRGVYLDVIGEKLDTLDARYGGGDPACPDRPGQ